VRERPPKEVVCVAGLRDHLESRLREQPCDPFAQQHVVFPDHHAQRRRHSPTVLQHGRR
jgi:hypothetical protein